MPVYGEALHCEQNFFWISLSLSLSIHLSLSLPLSLSLSLSLFLSLPLTANRTPSLASLLNPPRRFPVPSFLRFSSLSFSLYPLCLSVRTSDSIFPSLLSHPHPLPTSYPSPFFLGFRFHFLSQDSSLCLFLIDFSLRFLLHSSIMEINDSSTRRSWSSKLL